MKTEFSLFSFSGKLDVKGEAKTPVGVSVIKKPSNSQHLFMNVNL
jgi:hypothetical protein